MVKTHSFGGYLWPEKDKVTPSIVMKEVERLPLYLAHVPNRRVCVQAGGNVGVYATKLAEHFERVNVFEPDPDNLHCLRQNCRLENVVCLEGALGDKRQMVETWRTQKEMANYGATMIRPTSGKGVDMFVLDEFNLKNLDFLFLDIEGYEFPALLGAAQTILRCKPTISVEIKGLGKQHGFSDDELRIWLDCMKYKQVAAIGRDVIFTHQG